MKNFFILIFVYSYLAFYSANATIRYVKPIANGNGTGTSWANASSNIQAMIDEPSTNEVWIAAGTYTPSAYPVGCAGCGTASSTNRNNTFIMKFGVSLIGGFAGTETLKSERNFNLNETILSGDFGSDGNIANNAYHVLSIINCNNNDTFIEKLTIKKGNADGMALSVTVQSQTYFQEWGGGVLIVNSNTTLSKCSIVENQAISGGGMLITNFASPKINNSVFAQNTAQGGGGIYNHNNSSPEFTNCTISKNTANVAGGAMYNLDSNPTVTNSVVYFNNNPTSPSFNNNNSSVTSIRSIVAFGTSPCTDCPSTNGNENPQMENSSLPAGADNKWGTLDDGIRLSDCSVGIDYSEVCFNTDLDITGRNRAFDVQFRDNRISNPGIFCSSTLDLGAYESQSTNRKIIYVNNGSSVGDNDGSSWSNAYRTSTALQDAINNSCFSNEIWVGAGTYKPSMSPLECVGCSGPRDYSFFIREDIRLFGGFVGGETLFTQGDPVKNPTILSGDIGIQNNNTDNCYNVVTMIDNLRETVVYGFNVANANANGSGNFTIRSRTMSRTLGGGVLLVGGEEVYLEKCTFRNNFGNGFTANNVALLNINYSNFLENSGAGFKSENTLVQLGGDIFKQNLNSGLNITGGESYIFSTAIVGNSSTLLSGGVNFTGGSHYLASNLIEDNTGNSVAGGISVNGGNCFMFNNTIAKNSGNLQGGGLYNNDGIITLTNTIFWKNSLSGSQSAIGADIFRNSFTPGEINTNKCMLQLPANSSHYGDITDLNSLYAVNPQFINDADADGADNILRTPDDGYSLKRTSPAIDAGTPSMIESDIILRIGYVDIGAYEFIPKANCVAERHVADNPIEGGTHLAYNQITSNGTVGAATSVIFEADKNIVLLPGFTTQNTAIFKAEIKSNCLLIE